MVIRAPSATEACSASIGATSNTLPLYTQTSPDGENRESLFAQADLHLRAALSIWRTAHDSCGLGAGLYNHGELAFARYRLGEGHAQEDQIREALAWFQASVRCTEMLHVHTEWIFYFCEAAICVAMLLPHLAPAHRIEEAKELVVEAQRYLKEAEEVGPPADGFQGRLLAKAKGCLADAVSEYGIARSRPLE